METWRSEAFGEQQQYQPVSVEETDTKRTGLSRLYKAYDLDKQCYVAVHEVDALLASDPTFRQNFNEAMPRAQDANDANLLPILAHSSPAEDRCYVVTKWSEGRTLQGVVRDLVNKNQRPGILDVIEIVQQIGGALETLYLNNQWTRAINLQTVELVRDESYPTNHYRAVLIDLGLVGFASDALKQTDYCGQEYAYLTPERFQAGKPYTEYLFNQPGDVYALGVLFYELLLSKPPFNIQKVEDAAPYLDPKVRPLPPRIELPELPPVIEKVILKALAKDPQTRYRSARELVVALARALAVASSKYHEVLGRRSVKLIEAKVDDKYILPFPTALARPVKEDDQDLITIEKPWLTLKPGVVETTTNISVANRTKQVDRFRVEIERLPKEWYTITPVNEGSAPIDQAARFILTIRLPPDESIPARDYPFSVKVISSLRYKIVIATREAVLTVERITAYHLDEIAPQLIRADHKAMIRVVNLGNTRETFRFRWQSEENEFKFIPPSAVAIIDSGQEATVEFCPIPRDIPWFGKSRPYKMTAQVAVQSTGKFEIRKADVRVYSTFSFFHIALAILGLFGCLLLFLWFQSPEVMIAKLDDPCNQWVKDEVVGPAFAVCIQNPKLAAEPVQPTYGSHVTSLQLLLNQAQKIEIPITQTLGLTYTNSLTNTQVVSHYYVYIYRAPDVASKLDRPQIIARNWLGEQTWLGPLSWLGTSYYPVNNALLQPAPAPTPILTPIPTPAAQITRFCVNTDPPRPQPVCTFADAAAPATLPILFGDTPTLAFSWDVANLPDGQPVLDPPPSQLDAAAKTAAVTAPTDQGLYTYTLKLVDQAGQVTAPLAVVVQLTAVTCQVTARLLNLPLTNGTWITQPVTLQKSPGINYEVLGVLSPDQQQSVILRGAPVDYAQNTDMAQWVKVQIKETKEEGWLNYCSLSCNHILPEVCQGEILAPSIDEILSSGVTIANASDNSTDNQGNATANNPAGQVKAIQDLPKLAPEFSATLTPTPTPTPIPPAPTATPLPVVQPMINIQVDKESIIRRECVHVTWTITGVREVYFGYGAQDMDPNTLPPSNDNQDYTRELCDLKRNTTFMWRIILSYGADGKRDTNGPNDDIERVETRTVTVKAQPIE